MILLCLPVAVTFGIQIVRQALLVMGKSLCVCLRHIIFLHIHFQQNNYLLPETAFRIVGEVYRSITSCLKKSYTLACGFRESCISGTWPILQFSSWVKVVTWFRKKRSCKNVLNQNDKFSSSAMSFWFTLLIKMIRSRMEFFIGLHTWENSRKGLFNYSTSDFHFLSFQYQNSQ